MPCSAAAADEDTSVPAITDPATAVAAATLTTVRRLVVVRTLLVTSGQVTAGSHKRAVAFRHVRPPVHGPPCAAARPVRCATLPRPPRRPLRGPDRPATGTATGQRSAGRARGAPPPTRRCAEPRRRAAADPSAHRPRRATRRPFPRVPHSAEPPRRPAGWGAAHQAGGRERRRPEGRRPTRRRSLCRGEGLWCASSAGAVGPGPWPASVRCRLHGREWGGETGQDPERSVERRHPERPYPRRWPAFLRNGLIRPTSQRPRPCGQPSTRSVPLTTRAAGRRTSSSRVARCLLPTASRRTRER